MLIIVVNCLTGCSMTSRTVTSSYLPNLRVQRACILIKEAIVECILDTKLYLVLIATGGAPLLLITVGLRRSEGETVRKKLNTEICHPQTVAPCSYPCSGKRQARLCRNLEEFVSYR